MNAYLTFHFKVELGRTISVKLLSRMDLRRSWRSCYYFFGNWKHQRSKWIKAPRRDICDLIIPTYGVSGDYIKKRWASLRDGYVWYRYKVKKVKISGTGTENDENPEPVLSERPGSYFLEIENTLDPKESKLSGGIYVIYLYPHMRW